MAFEEKYRDSSSKFPFRGQGTKSMFYNATPIIFANARKLRNELTASEEIFWGLMKQHFPKFKFRRQHPVSQYVADFYCHKLKLVIEIDGGIHLSKETIEHDKLRDEFMQSIGLKVIRFTNDEVCRDGEMVVEKLKQVMPLTPAP